MFGSLTPKHSIKPPNSIKLPNIQMGIGFMIFKVRDSPSNIRLVADFSGPARVFYGTRPRRRFLLKPRADPARRRRACAFESLPTEGRILKEGD